MLDGDVGQPFGDVDDADMVGIADAILDRQARFQRFERFYRQVLVERDAATGKAVRIDHPDQQAGVGHRGLGTTLAIAGWPRIRPGATRTDQQFARLADRHEAATASADARYLDRQRIDDEVMLEFERGVDERLAVADEADVARRPADVGAEQIGGVDQLAEMGAADGAGGGTGKDDLERPLHRRFGIEQLGGAIGVVEAALEAHLAQAAVKLAGIVAVDVAHEHVDHGRRCARIFLGERRDVARDRARDVTQLLAYQLGEAALVRRIDVSVDQADRDCGYAAFAKHGELRAGLLLVQRDQHLAIAEHAFGDPAAQVAGYEWARRVAERPTPVRVGLFRGWAPRAAAVEHVALPDRSQEADLGQLAGNDRVEPVGAGMVEHDRVLGANLARAFQHAKFGVADVGRDLDRPYLAVLDRHNVGKSTAYVHPDQHNDLSPLSYSTPRSVQVETLGQQMNRAEPPPRLPADRLERLLVLDDGEPAPFGQHRIAAQLRQLVTRKVATEIDPQRGEVIRAHRFAQLDNRIVGDGRNHDGTS